MTFAKKHPFGLLLLMMNISRAQLGDLNAESYSKPINSASKIVMDERNCRIGYDLLNKLVTLRVNIKFMELYRH